MALLRTHIAFLRTSLNPTEPFHSRRNTVQSQWKHDLSTLCLYFYKCFSIFLISRLESNSVNARQKNCYFLLNPYFLWAVHVFGEYSMVSVACHSGNVGLGSECSHWRQQKIGKLEWIFGDVKVALFSSHWSWFIMLASNRGRMELEWSALEKSHCSPKKVCFWPVKMIFLLS